MTIKRTLKIFTIGVIMLASSAACFAQDLIARQAPMDRKMKAVDTLMMRSLVNREHLNNPSTHLYDD